MRRCLIVSPHFPPSTLAGVHRARHLANHLPDHGWEPTIVSVSPRFHVEPLDPALRELVRPATRIVECNATPLWLTAPFGLRGDIGLRGFFPLRSAIMREIGVRRPDVVMITGSPFYPMLLTAGIRRRYNLPVVLDFQDPWVSAEGVRRPRWSKAAVSHRLARAFEPRAVREASWITSVSERQNDELVERGAWSDRVRMSAIPIGGDPEDAARVRNVAPSRDNDNGLTVFSYVGNAWPRSTPVLEALFRGVRKLKDQNPDLAAKIRMRFVGTSNQPGDHSTFRVRPLAKAAGVDDLVIEEPARVPFLDALQILAKTDVALMFGSDEPHYTASKIYPVLMADRLWLSLFHFASSGHKVLLKSGGGIPVPFKPESAHDEVPAAVAEAISRIVCNPASLGQIDPAAYAPYTAHAVAGQFARVFDWLIR